jgi:hypothetical protein
MEGGAEQPSIPSAQLRALVGGGGWLVKELYWGRALCSRLATTAAGDKVTAVVVGNPPPPIYMRCLCARPLQARQHHAQQQT